MNAHTMINNVYSITVKEKYICNPRCLFYILHDHIHSVHSKDLPHKCDQCGNVFRTRELYLVHVNSHYGNKLYQCDKCKKKLVRERPFDFQGGGSFGQAFLTCFQKKNFSTIEGWNFFPMYDARSTFFIVLFV